MNDELTGVIWVCGAASVIGSLTVLVAIQELSEKLLEKEDDTEAKQD